MNKKFTHPFLKEKVLQTSNISKYSDAAVAAAVVAIVEVVEVVVGVADNIVAAADIAGIAGIDDSAGAFFPYQPSLSGPPNGLTTAQ